MDEIPALNANWRTRSKPNADLPNLQSVEEQLARILKSEAFAGSTRLQAFLEFTVTQHLKGNAEALKEYSIALEVFRAPPTYDPRIDSMVRSAASRLRAKLKAYYAADGWYDPILIDFPGGHYVPRFTARLPNPESNRASLALTGQEPSPEEGKVPRSRSVEPDAVGPAQQHAQGQKSDVEVDSAARDVLGAVQEPTCAEIPATSKRLAIRWPWVFAASAVVLLSLAMFAYWRLHPMATLVGRPRRKSIAVFGLQNLSGAQKSAWLSTAFAEMLRAELAAGEKLRIVSVEETARAKAEMEFRKEGTLSKESLTRLGRNLGADWVLLGSYVDLNGPLEMIRIDLHIQDTTAGETVATVSGSGAKTELFDLVSRAGAELRSDLGLQPISPALLGTLRASLPSTQAALSLYAEGVEHLRTFDAMTARDLLTKAIALDPRFPLSHSALAEAWSALGYDQNARKEANKALEIAGDLPREESWLIEARYCEMSREWEKAVGTYKKLWAFYPDVTDHGLRLAAAQTAAGRGKDALATVEELRQMIRAEHIPERSDPRIDLAEAFARDSLSDYRQELAAAQRAAQIGSDERAWLLVARAKMAEGLAFRHLGQSATALASFDRAKTLYSGVMDKRGRAAALNAIAKVTSSQDDRAATLRTYEEALALYREIGDKGGMATALNDLGVLLKNRQEFRGARKMYNESLAASREAGDRYGEARALFNMAFLRWGDPAPGPLPLYEKALRIFKELGNKTGQNAVFNEMGVWSNDHGQLSQALDFFKQTLEISRETGEKGAEALAYWNEADVLSNLGRLEESKRACEQAVAIHRELSLPLAVAEPHSNFGSVLYRLGDLVAARREYEEAARVLGPMDKGQEAARAQIGVALLDLEEGRLTKAESTVRNAVERFHAQKATEDEMLGCLALAKCLLREQKYKAAEHAIRHAEDLENSVRKKNLEFSAAILRARSQAGFGDAAGALRRLQLVLTQTKRLNYQGLVMEARLAVAEIQLKLDKNRSARQQLLALADEAGTRGFGLIARDARAASDNLSFSSAR